MNKKLRKYYYILSGILLLLPVVMVILYVYHIPLIWITILLSMTIVGITGLTMLYINISRTHLKMFSPIGILTDTSTTIRYSMRKFIEEVNKYKLLDNEWINPSVKESILSNSSIWLICHSTDMTLKRNIDSAIKLYENTHITYWPVVSNIVTTLLYVVAFIEHVVIVNNITIFYFIVSMLLYSISLVMAYHTIKNMHDRETWLTVHVSKIMEAYNDVLSIKYLKP